MNKREIAAIIIICLVLATSSFFILSKLIFSPETELNLDELLEKIDSLLAKSYLFDLPELLKKGFAVCRTENDLARLLKRSLKLAELSKDYNLAEELGLKAINCYPQSKLLTELSGYICLRSGKPLKTIELGIKFQQQAEMQALLAEASLRLPEEQIKKYNLQIPYYQAYLELEKTKDPQNFLNAARLFNEKRFYLDAALLYLQEGDLVKAAEIALSNLQEQEYAEFCGLLLYDLRDFPNALAKLKPLVEKNPERLDLCFILGDLYYLTEQSEAAARTYESIIEKKHNFSPLTYLNLNYIMQKYGFMDKALFLLKKADSIFAQNEEVKLELAKLYFKRGAEQEALAVLQTLLNKQKSLGSQKFYYLIFGREQLPPELFLIKLKDLFFEYPEQKNLAEVLFFLLLEQGRLQEAQAVKVHLQEIGLAENEDWLAEGHALLLALEGDLAKALSILKQAFIQKETWSLAFNCGVIELALGRLKGAEDYFKKSLALAKNDVYIKPLNLSKIYFNLAEVSYKKKENNQARLYLQEALKYEPANQKAFGLLKKLAETP